MHSLIRKPAPPPRRQEIARSREPTGVLARPSTMAQTWGAGAARPFQPAAHAALESHGRGAGDRLALRRSTGFPLDDLTFIVTHLLAYRTRDAARAAAGLAGQGTRSGLGRRIYDEAVREALIVIWEASDRICGKRLRPLVPVLVEAMERHGHLQFAPEVRTGLLAMSAATIDRALRAVRAEAGQRGRRRGSVLPRRSGAACRCAPSPTGTDPPPGFVEADLVAHSGPVASGSFVQTLVLTDIATGWTECAPLLVREQRLLTEVLSEMRKLLPFALLGFDTDNDSVFMNETVRDYCQAAGIEFTRCRPYRKNDQAWVEQKNGAVVRRIVGYRRFEGLEAAAALARLYATLAAVRELLPALVQAGREGTRGGAGAQALSPAGHAVPAAAGQIRGCERGPATWKRCSRHWIRFVCCSRSVKVRLA